MDRNRQFSLAYLFLETFWVAAALGLTRVYFVTPHSSDWLKPIIVATVVVWFAAIGGVFHRMILGAQIGGVVLLALILGDMFGLPMILRRLLTF